MNNDNTWFGFALYSPAIQERGLVRWLHAALIDDEYVVAGVKLYKLVTCSAKSWAISREQQINDKMMARIVKHCAEGKINFLNACDWDLDKDASLKGLEFFEFNLFFKIGRVNADVLNVVAANKYYNQSQIVSYLRKLAIEFKPSYGCIVGGLNIHHVSNTLNFVSSSFVEEYDIFRKADPDHPRLRFKREIPFYQNKEQQFNRYIPRASWGNILSSAHVEALGGVERIREESGAYLVERWGENLYIQLTESLWECTSEQLMLLNEFLEPARFPGAPEPVYLDLSSNPYPTR